MNLIVGLGNPGNQYINNRHNVGHMFADYLKTLRLPDNIRVIKTNTFMNNSGEFVIKYYIHSSLIIPNLWVLYDDLDIPLGSFKIQKGKGPKLHKGIISIDEKLGDDSYWHVRIGVDNRPKDQKISGEEYVLDDFTKDEMSIVNQVIKKAAKKLLEKIKNG